MADVATAYLLSSEARTAQTEFVATVSHELRTPMTNIAGFVEMLGDDSAGSLTPRQRGFVEAIGRNSDRLTALAENLLTVSGLESRVRTRARADVDLGEVVAAVRSSLATVIADRHLMVTFEIPDQPVVVHGDAPDLEAVVSNLVSNALKFTEDGGWVRCVLDLESETARIEVSDNGIGIPSAEQASLFERFFRSSSAQQQRIQGSGLGLAIVRGIVESHGGDVAVVSEHRHGSSFTVNLPLLDGHEVAAPLPTGA